MQHNLAGKGIAQEKALERQLKAIIQSYMQRLKAIIQSYMQRMEENELIVK